MKAAHYNDLNITLAHLAALARLIHEARSLAVAAAITVPHELAQDACRVVARALREAAR